ncbi:hypothetical protein [Mucilaginibacter sp. PAMB04168]|uniref:hypothetical protein n=1 Tax=Mucilaginibacter sp. PAMB04168 TaxID=3138567 RepID=UPI0031F623DF
MREQPFDIPVLLITFNRPDSALQVFERIKELQPSKLYVFSDAARDGRDEEAKAVQKCRSIFDEENITWDCKIEKWFCDSNMGCGRAVSSAISWMFKTEQSGIILEDDCLPDITFFKYCAHMLNKYANNTAVMHVAGTRWNDEFETGASSYFFSRIGHVWGWATWKRAWDLYDFEMQTWNPVKDGQMLYQQLKSRVQAQFWIDNFQRMYQKDTFAKDTWDYQWQYTLFKHQGLSVVPWGNLITNIGIEGAHADNSEDQSSFYRKTIPWGNVIDISANQPVKANADFDSYHIAHYFLKANTPILRLKWHLKSLYHLTRTY